ncbi:XRE family transcriptional regulator [Endozoicomonas lisbonensis]|uniref:Phage repressor protein C with HTH and peptisase S24 domain n=2 Tax=Endozoicomonas lisbonensis TaxID=3120522 RepID=A0ABV2SGT9_9GAMM
MQMETLGERVQFIQKKLGGSSALQQLTGISPSQQSRLIRDEIKSPGLTQISAIADAAGVTIDWLATGKGDPSGIQNASGYVAIPFIGFEVKAPFLFDRNYLVNVLGVPVEKAVMYHETSDCMEPSIHRDSYIVINTMNKQPNGMALIRVKDEEQLFLRYIQLNPAKGCVEVRSGSDKYLPFEVEVDDLEIIGTPAWFGAR